MKLENIIKPVNIQHSENHEMLIRDKMIEIELKYVENLFLKKIKPLSEYSNVDNIRNLISNDTQISSEIMGYFHGESNEKELVVFKNKILDEISDLYQKDNVNWIEKSMALLNRELEKYRNFENKEDKDDSKEYRAGLIHFGMEKNLGHLLPNSGIEDTDTCMQIHFKEFYKQKNDGINNLFSSDSLEKLAVKIKEDHPETKAIIAQSWLMDTPIADRIGFKIYDRDFDVGSNSSFWGQFIDSNGQIKSDEILKFLETGNPKYRIAVGLIKVEDFLKKYLPNDKRGVVRLKEITEESKNIINDFNLIFKEINEKFEIYSFEKIVSIINTNDILAGYLKTFNGQEFLNMLKKLKELKLDINNLDNFNYENKDEIRKNFNDFIKEKSNQYIDKEVFIQ